MDTDYCPPTPPLSKHQHLILTLGKTMGLGRGRCAVSAETLIDAEISLPFHIYFKKQVPYPPPLELLVLYNRRPVRDAGINTRIKSVEIESKRVQKKSAREDKSSR